MTGQRLRHQRHDVAWTVFQRLDAQAEGADAEIQVFAEFALLDGELQIFVGRCDHTNVEVDGGFAAQAVEFFLLQDAQQLGLQVHGHLANFVQEDGAAVGLFKQTFVLFQSASKSALLVTEQHVFDQVLWHGRAVEGHEWGLGAR